MEITPKVSGKAILKELQIYGSMKSPLIKIYLNEEGIKAYENALEAFIKGRNKKKE